MVAERRRGYDAPVDRQPSVVRRLLEGLAFVGVSPADSDDTRTRKVTLTLSASLVTVLAIAWVGTYLALGLPVSAAIPFGYQVASVVSLTAFARTKDERSFRSIQIVLILLLPFLLQWSLGGYVASSAVSLWALEGVFGAMIFYSASGAVRWFGAFLLLTVISGLLDPLLSQHAAAIPDPVRSAFFVLNITGVSVTAFVLLQYAVRARDAAFERSDRLLLNVLPRSIAERLKRGSGRIAETHEDVSVLFADVVDFTPFAERTAPGAVVDVLDEVFSAFDELARRHGMEKIKTIGDAYMVAAGVPEARPDHAEAAAEMALDMRATLRALCDRQGLELDIRIGIASGPVIAGVIGRQRLIYDLWGDTVNTASRMESHGVPGTIQVTAATRERLRDRYRFEDRGEIEVKGKGRVRAWLLTGRADGTPVPGT
jgi:class 3 adenylate cyclase